MQYQKIINLLDNAPNQPSKFRTKNWVVTNDDLHGIYNTSSLMKFKTSMLKSSLLDYSDAYILVMGTTSFIVRGIGVKMAVHVLLVLLGVKARNLLCG